MHGSWKDRRSVRTDWENVRRTQNLHTHISEQSGPCHAALARRSTVRVSGG